MQKIIEGNQLRCMENDTVNQRTPVFKVSPYWKEVLRIEKDLETLQKAMLKEKYPFGLNDSKEDVAIPERISCPGESPLEALSKHVDQFATKYGGCCYGDEGHIPLFIGYASLIKDLIVHQGPNIRRTGLNLASRFAITGVASRIWMDACLSIDRDDSEVREKATELIGLLAIEGIHDEGSVRFAEAGLSDPLESIRAEAALALANLAISNPVDKGCVDKINELLDSDDDAVLRKALTALGRLFMFGVYERSTLTKLDSLRLRYDDVGTMIKDLQDCLRSLDYQ